MCPVNINMGFGIRSRPTTPLIPLSRLRAMGVARVSLPRFMPAAALSGMQKALEVMKQCIDTGEMVDRPDLLVDMETITGLFALREIAPGKPSSSPTRAGTQVRRRRARLRGPGDALVDAAPLRTISVRADRAPARLAWPNGARSRFGSIRTSSSSASTT